MSEFRSTGNATKLVDDSKRQVEVEAPVYNVRDSYNTSFVPGVFTDSLAKRKPPMCFGHDWRDPIGHLLDFDDSKQRLRTLYQLDDFEAVPRARQAYAQIKSGTLTDASFGFSRVSDEPDPEDSEVTRITKADLDEISPVLVGAVPGAKLVGVRGIAAMQFMGIARQLENGEISYDRAVELLGDQRSRHSHAKQDGSGSESHSHINDHVIHHAHPGLMPLVGWRSDDRQYDPEQVRADAKFAMDDGSYPISTCADVSDAAGLAHHSKKYSFEQVKAHVLKAKNALNCPDSALPDTWKRETISSDTLPVKTQGSVQHSHAKKGGGTMSHSHPFTSDTHAHPNDGLLAMLKREPEQILAGARQLLKEIR